MPKPLKVVVWILVFAAAAGAGAVVASRSDPFPPGVEDPGAPTSTPVATSPSPTALVWKLRMGSDTKHVLHVGGSCASDWQIEGTVLLWPGGDTAGHAVANLVRPVTCDFAQSQVQTKAIDLVVTAARDHGELVLSFSEGGRTPVGSQDLGGFTNTLSWIHPRFPWHAAGVVHSRVSAKKPDGDLGTYTSYNQAQLRAQ